MKIEKALQIKKALITLSDAMNLEPKDIVSRICFFDKG